jgi:chromosome segregation ATPase
MVDKFYDEIVVIQFGLLVIISTILLWLWFYNRKKYHNLKHAIPANVVKNYLDSIIQNSTALKSSLFRGGGLDVDAVPSVLKISGLSGGESIGISGTPNTALMEELNQKKALIASLEAQLSVSNNTRRELETKITALQNQLSLAEAKIKELETLLAIARETGGGDESLKKELSILTKERDEIRERLKEFEIISDDLANLKRLHQENEQLKRSLVALQSSSLKETTTPGATSSLVTSDNITDILEDVAQPIDQNNEADKSVGETLDLNISKEGVKEVESSSLDTLKPNLESKASAESENNKSEKTPEDLLSEFEKMLG